VEETFFSGEKILEFFFLQWHILVYFIFLSDSGVPKHYGAQVTYSHAPLSADLFVHDMCQSLSVL